ncbi:MAG: hypothetical protein FD139_706 [Methylocystaceae bacterium]|nr:MAG: hypothetical protein FD148_23 [Methylocystaceae bacterium]KAF0213956.1 MAG: hypothetical protein FD172_80 [Methylocystaceae bacterium]TXT46861.1 MAG: hypothetical protein FD139_706 [Methylocystaceae bacterium]
MKNPQAPEEPKTYVTTERAGFVVAGRRIPPVYEQGTPARPTVGFELKLLDAEAEYELAQRTIALKKEPKNPKAEKTS